MAIGPEGIARSAGGHSIDRPSHSRRIPRARILSSAPFRPSCLRGETVSVFRVLVRVSLGDISGYELLPYLRRIKQHSQASTAFSDRHCFLLVLVRIQVGPFNPFSRYFRYLSLFLLPPLTRRLHSSVSLLAPKAGLIAPHCHRQSTCRSVLLNHSHGRAAVVRQPLYLNAVGESHRDKRKHPIKSRQGRSWTH